jgi:hypothetical protein
MSTGAQMCYLVCTSPDRGRCGRSWGAEVCADAGGTQEAALPFLYAQICFDSIPPLQKFIAAVEAAAAEGRHLAHHIRTLSLSAAVSASAWRNFTITLAGLVPILLQAINLQALTAWNIYALTAVPIFARTCPTTLQDMTLQLHSRAMHSALLHLHSLPALRNISLVIDEDVGIDHPRAAFIPPWNMPSLATLSLTIGGGSSLSRYIFRFLHRCDLAALQRLAVIVAIEDLVSADFLADLYAKLSLSVIDLQLPARSAHWYPHICRSIRAPSLYVRDPLPDEMLPATLPSTVQHLHFVSDAISPAFYTKLSIFDHLLLSKGGIQNIYLPAQFSWAREMPPDSPAGQTYTPSAEEDANLPQLLRYAILLARRGIHLRDGQGKTLVDYLQTA